MRRAIAVLSLVVVGCSPSATPDSGTDADSGMGADSGSDVADGGPDCDSPLSLSTQPCGGLAYWDFNDGGSTRPRNHHLVDVATSDAGTFLYVAGGFNSMAALDSVERLPVNADGTLGAAMNDTKLPLPLGGMTGGWVQGLLVIAGGQAASGANISLSYSAAQQADGSLGAWQTGGDVGNKRMHGGSFTRGDTIYVMGGFNDPNVFSDIVKATVSNGTLSAWTPAGMLPGPRSHFSVSAAGDYVYIAGGLDKSAYSNPPNLDEVQRGHVLESGEVGEWTMMPKLTVALATHGSFIYGGYLYVGGGEDNTSEEKRFWRSPIAADHSLGAWVEVAALPFGRGHVHSLPVFNDHVYSVAGALDFALNSTGNIYIGQF